MCKINDNYVKISDALYIFIVFIFYYMTKTKQPEIICT